jgi:hypothetical protein
MSNATLMNEDFPARIEAIFPNRDAATATARALCQRFEFDEARLSIVSPDQLPPAVHRNRYAFKASGRRLQRRQVAATLIAFAVIIVGLTLLHFIGANTLPSGLTNAIMAGLILAAVVITVTGMLSWRPVRVETRHRARGGETVLVIQVHSVSEQYALREALLSMGAEVGSPASAGVA